MILSFFEDHNFRFDRIWQVDTQRFVLKVADCLVAENSHSESWVVLFHYSKEAGESRNQPRDLQNIISKREADHARLKTLHFPMYLGDIPEISAEARHIIAKGNPYLSAGPGGWYGWPSAVAVVKAESINELYNANKRNFYHLL